MSHNEYWEQRLNENQFKYHTKRMEREVYKIIKKASKEIQASVSDLWLQMLEDGGEVSSSNLYRYSRYKKLQDNLNKILFNMSKEQYEVINAHLEQAYIDMYGEVATNLGDASLDMDSFTLINKQAIKEIVNNNFKDMTLSERIWITNEKLKQSIQDKVIESVVIGRDWKTTSKHISQRFNVSMSNAQRLIRTETGEILNRACLNSAKDRGYTKVKWLAENDSKICSECSSLDGKVFDINACPTLIHPLCRCTQTIVVESKK